MTLADSPPEKDTALDATNAGAANIGNSNYSTDTTTSLSISDIRTDGGTQMRVEIDEKAVLAYGERMAAGDIFPPVVVFYDGSTYWLADGFHRVRATRILADRIASDVRAGTVSDAIRFAIGANRANGLYRSNADKRMALLAALKHPEMSLLSDRAIAAEVGVSHTAVANARQQVATVATSPATKRTGRDGKKYTPVKTRSAPKVSGDADQDGEVVTAYGKAVSAKSVKIAPVAKALSLIKGRNPFDVPLLEVGINLKAAAAGHDIAVRALADVLAHMKGKTAVQISAIRIQALVQQALTALEGDA